VRLQKENGSDGESPLGIGAAGRKGHPWEEERSRERCVFAGGGRTWEGGRLTSGETIPLRPVDVWGGGRDRLTSLINGEGERGRYPRPFKGQEPRHLGTAPLRKGTLEEIQDPLGWHCEESSIRIFSAASWDETIDWEEERSSSPIGSYQPPN